MRRPLRAVATASSGLVLAFSLVSSLFLAGARYYYCDAMGLMASDPCRGDHPPSKRCEGAGALSEAKPDCCDEITLPSMPAGATAAGEPVAPAPLSGVLGPAEYACAAGADIVRASRHRSERWGPPPPLASERCAQRMVFLS
jgi:hypothetical protein